MLRNFTVQLFQSHFKNVTKKKLGFNINSHLSYTSSSFEHELEQLQSHRELDQRKLDPFQTQLLETTLGELNLPFLTGVPKVGQKIFPHGHSVYFPTSSFESGLGSDGYDKAYAPPSPPFSERVISSGKLEFNTTNWLEIGQNVDLVTTCSKLTQGHSLRRGDSISVEQKKVYSNDKGWSLNEYRTITYFQPQAAKSEAPKSSTPGQPKEATWAHKIHPTPVLLFRYSGLTFNSHRIHYDPLYCREIENYPDCLVHGPLICTLALRALTHALEAEGRPWPAFLESFSYRLVRPLFVNQEFTIKMELNPGLANMWIENNEGNVSLKGSAKLSQV